MLLSGGDSPFEHNRVLPQNIDAERALLGAMLDNEHGQEVIARILNDVFGNNPDINIFYRVAHGIIFKAILEFFRQNKPCDLVTLSGYLESTGELETVGGVGYIDDLIESVPTVANADYYAKIIMGEYKRRQLYWVASNIAYHSMERETDVDALLHEAQDHLVRCVPTITKPKDIKTLLTQAYVRVGELASGDGIVGMPSGLSDLDILTAGFQRKHLNIIAGRPGMGKSALVQNIAMNSAQKGHKVALFSLEASSEEISLRILSSISSVEHHRLRIGNVFTGEGAGDEFNRLGQAINKVCNLPLYIDDTAGLSLEQLRAAIFSLEGECGKLDMVIVDYLQLMSTNHKYDNKVQEVTEISKGLKNLAKDFDVSVIALSQLSRKVEERGDKRPILSDLRESGSIEQDADLVIFIYRDAYYDMENKDGTTELLIAKNRHGQVGSVSVYFNAPFLKFNDLRKEE